MKLKGHKNHRNPKYLSWLRGKNCVISGKEAECAHHIRLATNGGVALKPSDYFCIPLLNQFHTSGPNAIHIIGEETFLNEFKLDKIELFTGYLVQYLRDVFDIHFQISGEEREEILAKLIALVETKNLFLERKGPRKSKARLKKSTINSGVPKISITEDKFYQIAKEAKKNRDKELRRELKKVKTSTSSTSLKGSEFYENAKEFKRIKDKNLRQILKKKTEASQRKSNSKSSFSELAKEARKSHEKDLREKLKESQSKYRKEQYQKLKKQRASNESSNTN